MAQNVNQGSIGLIGPIRGTFERSLSSFNKEAVSQYNNFLVVWSPIEAPIRILMIFLIFYFYLFSIFFYISKKLIEWFK